MYDYDVVVVGATLAAHQAALRAGHWLARVAWVFPTDEASPALDTGGFPWPLPWGGQSWVQWRSQHLDRLRLADPLGADTLALTGIDVIAVDRRTETLEFHGNSPLGLRVGQRLLRSRRYLLALGSIPQIPALPGLETVSPFTAQGLLQDPPPDLPQSWIMVGSSPQTLAWAACLQGWGCQVTLTVATTHLLPQEDPDISAHYQHHWEAQGIRVITGNPALRVESHPQGVRVVGQQQSPIAQALWLDGSAVASATGASATVASATVASATVASATVVSPDIYGQGDRTPDRLQPWIQRGSHSPIPVNGYLQTPHPQIYACGARLGGYDLPLLAVQEGAIALDHALNQSHRPMDYAHLPYTLPLPLPLVRVGLTEPQSQRYRSLGPMTSLMAHCQDPLTGLPQMAKVILNRRGKILGFHGCGRDLAPLLALMTGAIAQGNPLPALLTQAADPWSFAVLTDWQQQWQHLQFQRHPRQEMALRWFFNWKRTGHV